MPLDLNAGGVHEKEECLVIIQSHRRRRRLHGLQRP